jgi:4-hydroxy-tetrahydrodipicolinate synthase
MQALMGTGVALVTPFNKDFSVDTEALVKIVNFCIDGGVEYLVVMGTTAENATLNSDEKTHVIKTVIKANQGRLPLVLGVGGNNTQELVTELKTKDLSDFEAILSVSPYYNKPTQEGIYQHYKAIATASPIPVILYNVPGRTSSNVLPNTVLRLAKDFKNIVAIKEAAGDMAQALQLLKNNMIALPIVLAGGSGVISVIGQGFPKEFSEMIRLGLNRKVDDAFQLQYQLMDSIDMIFEQGNPAGIKQVLASFGICENTVRLPLVCADDDLSNRISQFIANFNKYPVEF